MIRYYIIEHQTRGVLKDELNQEGNPSFSPTRSRADERNARYDTLRYARLDAQPIPGAYVVRTPAKLGERWQRLTDTGDWVDA